MGGQRKAAKAVRGLAWGWGMTLGPHPPMPDSQTGSLEHSQVA